MKMDHHEIIDSVNQCLNGNKEIYGSIVRCFQKKVYDLCYRFLATPQDAEDAASEVFVKAYRALGDFDPRYAFSTWLFRIAANHCVSALRRQRHAREFLSSEASDPRKFTETMAPDRVYFEACQREALEEALGSLPLKCRTVLLLKFRMGLSYQEIGAMMEIPVNTVGSLILRGKKALREALNSPRQEVLK